MPLVPRRMVVGPPDLRSLPASRDEAAFVLQRRLAERIRDVLARGLLTPRDTINLPKSCISCRRIWWWFVLHFAAIGLRRIADGERD